MSDLTTLLHVRAAGRDLLLATLDLREVVAPMPVAPLPGGPAGIQGVVIYQGEFLPVLDWKDLAEGCPAPGACMALAVLRPRLGLPVERVFGTLDSRAGTWSATPESDPWASVMAGLCPVGDQELPVLDIDRLIALLHRLHGDR